MKNNTVNEKDKQENEPVVIPDECGDTLWDAVLNQEIKACQTTKPGHDLGALVNKMNAEQTGKNDKDNSQ